MGLDQAIRKVSPEIMGKLLAYQTSENPDELEYPLSGDAYYNEMTEVWTGRKENHIHRAIEQLVGEVNNCDYVPLTKDNIQWLVERLQIVRDNPDMAEIVLPTQEGFFFGGTQYDEWYYKDIEQELEDFTKILNEWDEDSRYAYWAWW